LAEFLLAHRYARKRAKTQSIRQLFVNSFGGRYAFWNAADLFGAFCSPPSRSLQMMICNQQVAGSNPTAGSLVNRGFCELIEFLLGHFLDTFARLELRHGARVFSVWRDSDSGFDRRSERVIPFNKAIENCAGRALLTPARGFEHKK